MSIKENKIGVYEDRLKIAEEAEDELTERLVKMQEIKNLLQSENIDAAHLLNTKNALLNSENPERMLEPFGEKGVCICPFWHSKIVVPAKDIERAEELIGSELFCINEKDYPYEERFSNYDELIECTKNTLKKRRKILLKPLVYILIVVAGGFLSFLLSEAYNSPDEALIFMCFIGLLVLCYPFITKKHDLQKLMANYIDELEPKILSGQGEKYRLINDENIPEKNEMGEILRRMPGEILKQKNKIETEDGIEISDLEFWQRVSTSNGVVEVPVVGGIYIEMNKNFTINRNFYIADYYFGSILGAEKTVIDKENFKGTVIFI